MAGRAKRGIVWGAVVLAAALSAGLFVTSWAGDSVYSSGLLELGDGVPPPGMPGMADITADPEQSGPDWAEVFDANGVPKADVIASYGGQWAVFTADYISEGVDFEGDLLTRDGRVRNGVVSADDDIGNAYVYSTFDIDGNLVLFAAAERLGSGGSSLEFEFNQGIFRLGHGGFGQDAPWEVLGSRRTGDILVGLTFSGGGIGSVTASVWTGSSWMLLSEISGESCDAAETLCAISNAEAIEGGSWDGHAIEAGRFVEMGVNVGALMPGEQPAFRTIRLRTPQDAAFGYFGEGN